MNEFYEVRTEDYENGVYRVVGTGESIVMLKVGDLDNNRKHTGHIITTTQAEIDEFEETTEPTKNMKQRILSEIKMLPYILKSNFYRMKDNIILNLVSLTLLSTGVVIEIVDLGYLNLSTVLMLVGIIGLAASMSLFYNHSDMLP